jgi:hypothetical protein
MSWCSTPSSTGSAVVVPDMTAMYYGYSAETLRL